MPPQYPYLPPRCPSPTVIKESVGIKEFVGIKESVGIKGFRRRASGSGATHRAGQGLEGRRPGEGRTARESRRRIRA